MSDPESAVSEKVLLSVVQIALEMLELVPALAERDRMAGQDPDPGTVMGLSHVALRAAVDFLEQGMFPDGIPPRTRAIAEAATVRLTREFTEARRLTARG